VRERSGVKVRERVKAREGVKVMMVATKREGVREEDRERGRKARDKVKVRGEIGGESQTERGSQRYILENMLYIVSIQPLDKLTSSKELNQTEY